jgi:hypothetical protein
METPAPRLAGLRLAGACLVCFTALLGSAAPAVADAPPPPPPPPPAAPPAKLSPTLQLFIGGSLKAKRRSVGVKGERVRISGSIAPYASSGRVVVRVVMHGREVRKRTPPVVAAEDGKSGRFVIRFRPRRAGRFTVRAKSTGTDQYRAVSANRKRLVVVTGRAHAGSRGIAVRALQRRLAALHYISPVNGFFGASTGRAVLAFRKVNGMGRSEFANRAIFRKLARGGGGFHVRHPKAGKHAEFDWSRQVLVLARGARPAKIVHASSGKPSTPTVFGHFHFYSKTAGYNSHSMYFSNYFIGGYAIHGYAEVPPYAASHGCIRIPIANAVSVYRWIGLGDDIFVYR